MSCIFICDVCTLLTSHPHLLPSPPPPPKKKKKIQCKGKKYVLNCPHKCACMQLLVIELKNLLFSDWKHHAFLRFLAKLTTVSNFASFLKQDSDNTFVGISLIQDIFLTGFSVLYFAGYGMCWSH